MVLPELKKGTIINCILPVSLAWSEKTYTTIGGYITDNFGRKWGEGDNPEMEFEVIVSK